MLKPFRYLYYKWLTNKIIKEYGYDRPEFEDRDILERIIFPYVLINYDPKRILDIGREDYQSFYNEFFRGRELWTIDKDPGRAEFGADKHITDNAANLKNHFKDNYFDFILMNGVFGWGLNKQADIEKTFDAIHDILGAGGVFILGWNDVPDLTPMPLARIKALQKLQPLYFKPLKGARFKANTGEHTYNFFIKK